MFTWLRNASIGTKVALAPAIGVLGLVMMGGVAWYTNHELGNSITNLGENRLPMTVRIDRLQVEIASVDALVNQSLAWEGAGFKEEKIAALDKHIGVETKRVGDLVAAIAADKASDPVEHDNLAKLASEYPLFRKAATDALDIKTGMVGNAAAFMSTIDNSYGRMNALFAQLISHEQAEATGAVDEGRSLRVRNGAVITVSCLGAALLAAIAAALTSRLIVEPLRDASRVARAMSMGDFSVRADVTSHDATGQVLAALTELSNNVGQMVQDIRDSAAQVQHASQEIASGNHDLSHRTEITASSLQRTASAIDQMAETLRHSADGAMAASHLARDARDAAHEGGAVVAEVVVTMGLIDQQAKKIREIIGVIDSIAFQTNILALNAAVEAARAGEQGRGFAVVAGEVRLLAQRSSEASKEIRALIGASVAQAEKGAAKVGAAGISMERLVAAIEKVHVTVEGISVSMAEQADGITQVNSAVAEMDRTTQQNAALVQEATAATESLKDQAERLSSAIGALRTA